MQRYRRSDATYQHAVTREPARPAIGSDFGECLLTGSLLAAVVILGDRAILGTWCELPAMGFVWSLCVLACWLRVRWVQRVPEPVQHIEGPQRDRLVLLNAGKHARGDVTGAYGEPLGPFETFVVDCGRSRPAPPPQTSCRQCDARIPRFVRRRHCPRAVGPCRLSRGVRRLVRTGPAQQCRPER